MRQTRCVPLSHEGACISKVPTPPRGGTSILSVLNFHKLFIFPRHRKWHQSYTRFEFGRSLVARLSRGAHFAVCLVVCLLPASLAFADGSLTKVNHIIIVMQENHSFDNYFGALAYAPGSPYHNGNGSCSNNDHSCLDGLTCTLGTGGSLTCTNSNLDDDGRIVYTFHGTSRCVLPDLDHGWVGTHLEMNFENPNSTLKNPISDGFVRQNDLTEQIDNGESPTEDQTISFYTQDDLPFYYSLAQTFAISDRQFASVLGPTFPNRSYLMAATSFGHLTTNDTVPPPGGYKPITGTIFDLFDKNGVTWADFFEDVPQSGSFRPTDPHNLSLSEFMLEAAGSGSLPQVSFVDPDFGIEGHALEDDEHPPTDIQRGQYHVSQIVNAVRNGPFWKDSIIFILYDEHGGFYDHAKPPAAPQKGAPAPDGINPGQCEDLSNPPASEQPGQGAECSYNFTSTTDTTLLDAEALCPALTANPTGPFPQNCASFDQLGVRIPFIAVSPFSKPSYVSHQVGDHTSLLALIEKRFLNSSATPLYLTNRDQNANDLESMFDFTHSPSLHTPVGQAQPPVNDCTPQ
jgi:phospholipase C